MTHNTYPHLIGLTGHAGTGKDTVRAMLEQRGFVGLAFADPIRQMIRDLFSSNGISESYMDERALKEQPIPQLGLSYRHLAQTLGTEWGRRCLGEGFWLNIAAAYMADITTQTFGPLSFVISDVRFPNEAAWVKQRGGQLWRIVRHDAPPVRDHDSERLIDSLPYDQRIVNDWTLDDLEEAVCAALEIAA